MNTLGMGGGGGYDLYVRKDMECQRRYQKLMTDLVEVTMMMAEGSSGGGDGTVMGGGGGGRKRSSTSSSGGGVDKK